ncbi:3-isopropylmalate dehydrogenase [Caldalkalibacillus thermarum]|uniref:3-isopropylmalate dehydrogenase n=1 Tax=Caldalkalibacillus thermarum TaxID=296745 RepID=UPI0019B7F989|nr:3-isopropylmalate dehydrogenase [Caldalkalibacillus thermarum]GGK11718.1 3-isopropylmalate dehydrogenase [Caldalkalibacillus thermarum]
MIKQIAVLPGDGIGPEVTEEAVRLLEEVGKQFGHTFQFQFADIGGCALDKTGTPLPEETLQICRESDAILLGAVGGPKWDHGPGEKRPEAGLLKLRKELQLYANLRPVIVFPALVNASTLKPEVLEGVNLMIIRELTGGLYFGQPRGRKETDEGLAVVDTLYYTEAEIERVLRKAFEIARLRKKHLVSVDKANVLDSSRLWRETADRIGKEYPDVKLEHMLVDNAAMQLIRRPGQFDTVVTENMFGDILSDEAAMLSGSLGMLPSASLSDSGPGLYEPVHGSAPDIAGQNLANPLATFLSVAMMLKYSFNLEQEAQAIEQAIHKVLEDGYRTRDLAQEGERYLTTTEMGEKVRAYLKQEVPS